MVRQLPKKVEVKPEWRAPVEIVNMAEAYRKELAAELDILSNHKKLPPELDTSIKEIKRALNVEELKDANVSRDTLLKWILQYYYAH